MAGEAISDDELDRRVARRVFLIALLFFPAVGYINAASLSADAARAGVAMEPLLPWIAEFSSVTVIVALVPLIAFLERRFPVAGGSWPRLALAHVAGSLAFSALHVAGMVALRHPLHSLLLDRPYRFFDAPVADLVYEYRKDVLPYAVIVMVLSLLRAAEETRREAAVARGEARETGRLTLKSGGRTIFVDAATTEWARAAGNYAELRAGGRTHLPRVTLAALEAQLRDAGVDMVRIHRSHIVNRALVAEIVPSGDGDFRVRMKDGSEIRGSRRFRDRIGG